MRSPGRKNDKKGAQSTTLELNNIDFRDTMPPPSIHNVWHASWSRVVGAWSVSNGIILVWVNENFRYTRLTFIYRSLRTCQRNAIAKVSKKYTRTHIHTLTDTRTHAHTHIGIERTLKKSTSKCGIENRLCAIESINRLKHGEKSKLMEQASDHINLSVSCANTPSRRSSP